MGCRAARILRIAGALAFAAGIAAAQFTIQPDSLRADYVLNSPYSVQFDGLGGKAPYTLVSIDGALPSGYSVDLPNRTLSGQCLSCVPGTYYLAVRMQDAAGVEASRTYAWTIYDYPHVIPRLLPASPTSSRTG